MDDCIFCKIVAGKAPAHIIAENSAVIVLTTPENHPLIIPKAHIQDIFSLDSKTGAEIMAESIKVSKATKQAVGADGIYVAQSNGSSAGQVIFHYHMHIYPRWDDGRAMPKDDESRKLTTAKIKSAYDSLSAQG